MVTHIGSIELKFHCCNQNSKTLSVIRKICLFVSIKLLARHSHTKDGKIHGKWVAKRHESCGFKPPACFLFLQTTTHNVVGPFS